MHGPDTEPESAEINRPENEKQECEADDETNKSF
jgi:hypothetical protein